MTLRRGIQVIAVVLTLPSSMPAQNRDTITTRLVMGAGPRSFGFDDWTPVYSVGVERRPRASSITFRLSMVLWESESSGGYGWLTSSGIGAEFVGVRTFGRGRLQPYVFAGAGIHRRAVEGVGRQFTLTDSGFVAGPSYHYTTRVTRPSIVWGVGTSVRIGTAAIFGEVRMPVYNGISFQYGLLTPLMAGIRF